MLCSPPLQVNEKVSAVWTDRESEIAAALFRCPRTSEQILGSSRSFHSRPFGSLGRLQNRLAALQHQGCISRRRYRRSIEKGNSFYYQLTLAGYRQWRADASAQPPRKRFFAEVSEPHHHHQYDLARFWTATENFAADAGYTIGSVQPEGSFSLTDGTAVIQHDGLLPLVSQSGRVFWVFLELDRSTERLTSSRDDVRHWRKVLNVYDHLANHLPAGESFRVWAVCSGSRQRAANIAELFGEVTDRENRQLLLSFPLEEFVASSNGLLYPLAQDHRRDRQLLLPRGGQYFMGKQPANWVEMLTACR